MSDPFVRKIQMLKLIGSHKQKKGVREIHEALIAQGFDVNIRSVQRDMKLFEQLFDIESDGDKDQPGWSWKKDSTGLLLANMEPSTAIAFKLAECYLKDLLPQSTLDNLQHYFKDANNYLQSNQKNKLSQWHEKVMTISRTQPFITPDVDKDIQETIYEGLLFSKQLTANYKGNDHPAREYTINPVGIVIVDGVTYLLGTLWRYTDVRQFAMHRFIDVALSEENAIEVADFDQQAYVENGNFGFPRQNEEKKIKLVFHARQWVSSQLTEQPLSVDQEIAQLETNSSRNHQISATVINTAQLRWWLSHFVDNIEIISPTSLRKEFIDNARALTNLYDAH